MSVVEPDLFGEVHRPPARTAPAASAVPAAAPRPGPPVQTEAFPIGDDQFPGQGSFVDATGTDARLDVVLFAPPDPVPCIDCGRPLTASASRRRGRGKQCDQEYRARQRPPAGEQGTLQ